MAIARSRLGGLLNQVSSPTFASKVNLVTRSNVLSIGSIKSYESKRIQCRTLITSSRLLLANESVNFRSSDEQLNLPIDALKRAMTLPIVDILPSLDNVELENEAFQKKSLTGSIKYLKYHRCYHFQRLEFLGDRAFNLSAAEIVFLAVIPPAVSTASAVLYLDQESTFYEKLTSNAAAAKFADRFKEFSNCKNKDDTWEAYLGALYLTKGYGAVQSFLAPIFKREIDEIIIKRSSFYNLPDIRFTSSSNASRIVSTSDRVIIKSALSSAQLPSSKLTQPLPSKSASTSTTNSTSTATTILDPKSLPSITAAKKPLITVPSSASTDLPTAKTAIISNVIATEAVLQPLLILKEEPISSPSSSSSFPLSTFSFPQSNPPQNFDDPVNEVCTTKPPEIKPRTVTLLAIEAQQSSEALFATPSHEQNLVINNDEALRKQDESLLKAFPMTFYNLEIACAAFLDRLENAGVGDCFSITESPGKGVNYLIYRLKSDTLKVNISLRGKVGKEKEMLSDLITSCVRKELVVLSTPQLQSPSLALAYQTEPPQITASTPFHIHNYFPSVLSSAPAYRFIRSPVIDNEISIHIPMTFLNYRSACSSFQARFEIVGLRDCYRIDQDKVGQIHHSLCFNRIKPTIVHTGSRGSWLPVCELVASAVNAGFFILRSPEPNLDFSNLSTFNKNLSSGYLSPPIFTKASTSSTAVSTIPIIPTIVDSIKTSTTCSTIPNTPTVPIPTKPLTIVQTSSTTVPTVSNIKTPTKSRSPVPTVSTVSNPIKAATTTSPIPKKNTPTKVLAAKTKVVPTAVKTKVVPTSNLTTSTSIPASPIPISTTSESTPALTIEISTPPTSTSILPIPISTPPTEFPGSLAIPHIQGLPLIFDTFTIAVDTFIARLGAVGLEDCHRIFSQGLTVDANRKTNVAHRMLSFGSKEEDSILISDTTEILVNLQLVSWAVKRKYFVLKNLGPQIVDPTTLDPKTVTKPLPSTINYSSSTKSTPSPSKFSEYESLLKSATLPSAFNNRSDSKRLISSISGASSKIDNSSDDESILAALTTSLSPSKDFNDQDIEDYKNRSLRDGETIWSLSAEESVVNNSYGYQSITESLRVRLESLKNGRKF